FATWLRILIHQCADATRLRSRKEVGNHPPRRQDDRIFSVGHLGRGAPFHGHEMRFSVRVAEPAAFVKAWRSRMVFIRAWPEEPVCFINALPGHSRII